jgi:hypothetical protein
MANKHNPLDELFREKLIDHQVVPSPEAWKKIEANLPAKSVSLYTYWWAVAASIALVLVGSYVLTSMQNNPTTENSLADKTTNPIYQETIPVADPADLQLPVQAVQITLNTIAKTEKKIQKTPEQDPKKELGKIEHQVNNQLAQVENKPTPAPIENIKPDLQIQEPFSTAKPIATSELANLNLEEEPLYRVNIYSNGIKKENNPKNLFTELHKTVNQVENILEKVDDGLSIQNLKTNLSQTLSSKKEKQSEKP